MKRYFDHTEKERSEMTAETVESLMARELMEAGIVKPEKPVLEEVPTFETTKTRYYRVKSGDYCHTLSGIAFLTLQDAEAFTKLGVVSRDSGYGSSVEYVKPFAKLSIEPEEACSQEEFIRVKEIAEKAKAIKAANDKAVAAYNAECKASIEVTDGVWTDWRECRAKAQRIQRIYATYEEYYRMCDSNESVASRFLAKSFSIEQLKEADEWLGTSLSDPLPSELAEQQDVVAAH